MSSAQPTKEEIRRGREAIRRMAESINNVEVHREVSDEDWGAMMRVADDREHLAHLDELDRLRGGQD